MGFMLFGMLEDEWSAGARMHERMWDSVFYVWAEMVWIGGAI